MSNTARLLLPYIAPQQAQKQVTYNEAMATLDMLVQPAVKSRTTTVPPVSPTEGDTYIVAVSATGAWAGKDGKFAAYIEGGWEFRAPGEGWLAFAIDTAELAVFTAGAWANFFTTIGASFAKLGINATADLTDRLSVAATASLFSHAGAGHQLKINKSAAANTASLLFEDNLSARAEIGLAGDDNLHLKVSPDGVTWFETLSVDRSSGLLSLADTMLLLKDDVDPTKTAKFELSGISATTLRTYTLPNSTGTLAITSNLSQTFSGTTSFSNATGNFGTATTAATYGLGASATTTGVTKAINIGTAGLSGSVTAIALGSAVSGATGTTTINTPVALVSGQLGFPATQLPSVDPNTLDDYEEGVWTPTFQFAGVSTGITYGAQTLGRYTKIGRLVTATCNVTLTSKGSATGSAQIAGLPFTSLNDSIYGSASIGFAGNLATITGSILGIIQPNTSKVTLYYSNNGAAIAVSNANCTNTTTIYVTASYEAA